MPSEYDYSERLLVIYMEYVLTWLNTFPLAIASNTPQVAPTWKKHWVDNKTTDGNGFAETNLNQFAMA